MYEKYKWCKNKMPNINHSIYLQTQKTIITQQI